MAAAGRSDSGEPAPGGSGSARRAALPATAWAAIAVGVSLVVHSPVLKTWFHNDDLLHLYQLANFGVIDFVLAAYGGHLYALRVL